MTRMWLWIAIMSTFSALAWWGQVAFRPTGGAALVVAVICTPVAVTNWIIYASWRAADRGTLPTASTVRGNEHEA